MRKRILSLALALVMCVGLLPTPTARAYEARTVGAENLFSASIHTGFIDEQGTLWMWGYNSCGQLGDGTTESSATPIDIMHEVTAVSCGGCHTAALVRGGQLYTWGDNGYGQLGDYSTDNCSDPILVLEDVVTVSCGGHHTAAIKEDGTLWTWGSNSSGQLGNGTNAQSLIPIQVMDHVVEVCCGYYSTAAIKEDGTLWLWGNHNNTPQKVMDDVATVSCGDNCYAAIKTDGTLWYNGTQIMEKVAALCCGSYHCGAITTDGTLYMWGSNGNGQLGNGSIISIYTDQPVPVMYDVAAVCCGADDTFVIKNDGSVWAWGWNSNGQMTLDPQEVRAQPVPMELDLKAPLGVKMVLNGGTGTRMAWVHAGDTLDVPQNPTRKGFLFAGWYTDEELTEPYNFNDEVTEGFALFAKWKRITSTGGTASKSSQRISLNGSVVTLDAYALKDDSNGGDSTFVKLRDVAAILNTTDSRFNIDWKNGAIYVSQGERYTTRNGSELKAISGTDGSYEWNTAPVLFDGVTKSLEGIVLTDGQGGGHTFFKLRDLGKAIGFTVGWSVEKGIYIETN